jgi:hypothetical protein
LLFFGPGERAVLPHVVRYNESYIRSEVVSNEKHKSAIPPRNVPVLKQAKLEYEKIQ